MPASQPRRMPEPQAMPAAEASGCFPVTQSFERESKRIPHLYQLALYLIEANLKWQGQKLATVQGDGRAGKRMSTIHRNSIKQRSLVVLGCPWRHVRSGPRCTLSRRIDLRSQCPTKLLASNNKERRHAATGHVQPRIYLPFAGELINWLRRT